METESVTVTGTVQALNQKEGKYGIKIGDQWYNGFGKGPMKNSEVQVTYVSKGQWKNISAVTVLKEAPVSSGGEGVNKESRMIRMNALNNATQMMALLKELDMLESKTNAREVLESQLILAGHYIKWIENGDLPDVISEIKKEGDESVVEERRV